MICPPTTRSVDRNARAGTIPPQWGEVHVSHWAASRSSRALHAQRKHPEGQSLAVGPFDPSPNEAPSTIRAVSTPSMPEYGTHDPNPWKRGPVGTCGGASRRPGRGKSRTCPISLRHPRPHVWPRASGGATDRLPDRRSRPPVLLYDGRGVTMSQIHAPSEIGEPTRSRRQLDSSESRGRRRMTAFTVARSRLADSVAGWSSSSTNSTPSVERS